MELHEIVEKTVAYLEKNGQIDDAIVTADSSLVNQIRFSKNQIIVSKSWQEIDLSIFLSKDKKVATTSITDLSSIDNIYRSLDDLLAFTKSLEPNKEYYGIAEGPLKASETPDIYDPKLKDFFQIAVDKLDSALNIAMEEGAKDSAGTLDWSMGNIYTKTNHNIEMEEKSSRYQFVIRSFVSPTESGQGLSVGRMLNQMDMTQAGQNAGYIANASRGGKPGKGGTFNALLSPTVVADIVARTPDGANPFNLETGNSWLNDKLGEQLASEHFTVHDDGRMKNGWGSQIVDDEGVPTQRTTIFEKGVFKGLIHNTNTARKYGTESTGNAGVLFPRNMNLVFEPGDYSFDEMIKECKKPTIYVTSNWYTRTTSAIEGVFSTIPRDGMFLIENGEIQKPIRELRISDSYPNLIKNITGVQNKLRQIKWWVEVVTPTFAPAMLIENINFSTGTK